MGHSNRTREFGYFFIGLLVRAGTRIVCMMAPGPAIRLATFLGSIGWFIGIRKSLVRDNLQQCFPHWSRHKRDRVGRQSIENLCMVGVESIRLLVTTPKQLRTQTPWDHPERFKAAWDKGKGLLSLSAHLGSFELIATSIVAHGLSLGGLIGRDIRQPETDQLIKSCRSVHKVDTISPKGAARATLAMLKEKGTIGVVLDQRISRKFAVMVDFFGRPAPTMPFLAVIAERTGAPVVPVFSVRKGVNRHQIVVLPEVPFIDTGDRQENIRVNTQRYTAIIEHMVRRYPEQWLWAHRRWIGRRAGNEDLVRN